MLGDVRYAIPHRSLLGPSAPNHTCPHLPKPLHVYACLYTVYCLSIPSGYLATTADEYAACVASALDRYEHDAPGISRLRERAREAAKTYSDEAFQAGAVRELASLLV